MPRERKRKEVDCDTIVEPIKKNALKIEPKITFQLNEIHQNCFNLLNKHATKMVFIDGPSGAGKTYLAVASALTALQKRQIDSIYYIRSVVESASKQIGHLPGEIDDKFLPWSMPLIEKITELTDSQTAKMLLHNETIKGIPVNFCRGLTFHRSFVIVDEAQNLSYEELMVILTRFGEHTKYVVIGDSKQADIKNSGFTTIYNAFDNTTSSEKHIHNIKFTKKEIVRSEILSYIVEILEATKK